MTARAFAGSLLAISLLAGSARSSTLTKQLLFENPAVVEVGGGFAFEIKGCRNIGVTGEPILPVYPARFIIAPNETAARVTVETERTVTIDGPFIAAPMPPQIPLAAVALPFPSRNEAVYASRAPYPAERAVIVTEQVVAGIRVVFVNVYPVQVIPSTGQAVFAASLKISVETVPSFLPGVTAPPAQVRRALAAVGRFVENPEAAAGIRGMGELEPQGVTGELAHYVIITSAQFAASFQPLAELKARSGLRTRIIDIEWILSNFTGTDTQDKIRNFIKYAYANWQTQYVLLGGDDEIIPHRGFYVKFGMTIDSNIPSDLYYGCLDGNWNTDGDAYFGEPGEEDLLPEVTIGRLPVDSAQEIANVIGKVAAYELSPVDSQCTTALMLGELLWSTDSVNTFGCDYKDEIRYGSSNFGITTAGIPPSFSVATLYDRDLGTWGKSQLLPILNAGVHFVNHLGHSSLYTVMRLTPEDVPSLTNDGVNASFFVCYSQGCYAASFDNRDDAGVVHAEDCIGEELVTGPNGAVAFIGNTRFGWAAPNTTCGVSQFFDRQFFDAIFGDGISALGDALTESRLENIPYIAYDGVRWVYYELCLLGDPSLPLWTDAPRSLTASYDSLLFVGQGGYEVRVTDSGGALAGALTCLSSPASNVYCSAVTDDAGRALLDPEAEDAGSLTISIVSPNHYPLVDTIQIVQPAPYLASIDSISASDDSVGGSQGNDNGIVEPGETIDLTFTLVNRGQNPLENTVVTLATCDTVLHILDSTYVAGDVSPGSSVAVDAAFSVEICLFAPNGHRARIELRILSDEGEWKIPESVTIGASDVLLESWSMSDVPHGNGNGCIEAWEFQNLLCTWRNRGAVDVLSPKVTLSFPSDSWGQAIKWEVQAPVLAAGSAMSFPGELLWFVDEFAPPLSQITMFLNLRGTNIPAHAETLQLRTCGYVFDAAGDAEEPISHRSIVGVDEWHLSDETYLSSPKSWKCGGPPGGTYANFMEAVLELPPLCLFTGSSMTFWHRMSAEAGTTSPYWAFDAGVVELSQDDGKTWKIISPTTPYPSRASPYNSIFLAPYQRCYSGTFDWKMETFDLSAYEGPVLIRFHFASDEQYGYEGWYLDDIHVTTEVPSDVPRDGTRRLVGATRLDPGYPNPFNPSTLIPFELAVRGTVEVAIYDLAGTRVRTLLDAVRDEGRYTLVWNGTNDRGKPVASGVYFCRLRAGAYTATQRLVLIR